MGLNSMLTLMEIASLPQELLLHVLSFLPPGDLLRCRATCRRWRDLAVLPALWRHKNLDAYAKRDSELVAAAMRLVPCLHKLWVSPWSTCWDSLGAVLPWTNCAVSHLHLGINLSDAVLVTAVLGRQAALGKLKHLNVYSCDEVNKKSLSKVHQLLEFLLHTQGLESIVINIGADPADIMKGKSPLLNAAKSAAPVPASLRKLVYCSTLRDPCLPRHLEWHAATLEVVELRVYHPGVTPLLAALPRLRELQCTLLEDMPALLQCPSLKKVHLLVNLDSSPKASTLGVAEYLRAAVSRLEELVLEFSDSEYRGKATNLVLSLAGSRHAAQTLRSLTLKDEDDDISTLQATLPPLAAILHRLKALVTLHVPNMSNDLLDALDGDALPNLEQLSFNSPERCPHEWIHGEQVRAVLGRCPRLHLLMNSFHDLGSVSQYCLEHTCHDLPASSRCTLFSHPKNECCGVKHIGEEIHISL
ncbi:uncharacterized protein LOC117649462 isoform X3 [Thrips palmi]|uniref:Uncharacterized protein LOC117649462 isoform X3 n=1 Tax=Thrips palmi TaxID=161013 RepID=A0A6P8ZSF5_THRPL|nr:uncharacterized protein LOC117649462 isoform X3 [Thrips palmi]